MTVQFLTEAPAPTAAHLAEIAQLEQAARDKIAAANESFDRCDTDGFLTQWAHGLTADLNRRKAELLKTGGYATFPVLCDAEGNVVATKVYTFDDKFKPWTTVRRWKLPEALAAKAGRKWVPFVENKTSRVQTKLGLHEEDRWFPAYAKITGRGTGLSGSAWVAVFKKGEE